MSHAKQEIIHTHTLYSALTSSAVITSSSSSSVVLNSSSVSYLYMTEPDWKPSRPGLFFFFFKMDVLDHRAGTMQVKLRSHLEELQRSRAGGRGGWKIKALSADWWKDLQRLGGHHPLSQAKQIPTVGQHHHLAEVGTGDLLLPVLRRPVDPRVLSHSLLGEKKQRKNQTSISGVSLHLWKTFFSGHFHGAAHLKGI